MDVSRRNPTFPGSEFGRATYAGCVAGMATGFAIALLWPEIYKDIQKEFEIEMEMYNLVVAFSAALAVNVVVSLLTPKRISALT